MSRVLNTILIILSLSTTASFAAVNLVMVEEPGCVYCREWQRKIGPVYPKTDEASCAPLEIIDIGSSEIRSFETRYPVRFTPTFLLIEDGAEISRIEGYPGEDFFWGLLGMMLDDYASTNSLAQTDPCSVGFIDQAS